jgi:tRNA dimethylallyltransferase
VTETAVKPIYAIAGPTASGKTALGVQLAKHVGGEVVNFDSVQIYRKIQIATAKPTDAEKQGIPHHLIDYVDPNVSYTAAAWAADAARVIGEIETRGARPILVGGTGFYLRSLLRPLFDGPRTDPKLRARLQAIAAGRGAGWLYKMLVRVDPAAADKIFPNDTVRVVRALEVFFQTGRRISAIRPERPEPAEFVGRIKLFVLEPPRDELYARIDRRTNDHFAAGLVDEVRRLLDEGVDPAGNALGAHGYRRVREMLAGERTLENAIEKTAQDVRNYAKRQLTWFRREPGALWLKGFGNSDEVWHQLLENLGNIGLQM